MPLDSKSSERGSSSRPRPANLSVDIWDHSEKPSTVPPADNFSLDGSDGQVGSSEDFGPISEHQALLGQVLQDTYRVERLLGGGGMGAVFEVSHLRLRRHFAVKVLSRSVASNPETVTRFRREAEVTSELGHPHIVEVIDFNLTNDGLPYILMELLEGEDLGERIKRDQQLSPVQAGWILSQASSALQAAHSRGIIHRDLKPQNVFLCHSGERNDFVKIVDFGISKVLGAQGQLTGTRVVMGTPWYMSPEQAEGKASIVDQRTDIWAMGAILYEMLTGRPPFTGESIPEVLYKIVHKDPLPPRSYLPDLAVGVENIVLKALSKKQQDRFSTMAELTREYGKVIRQTVVSDLVGAAELDAEKANTLPELPAVVESGEDVSRTLPDPDSQVERGENEDIGSGSTVPGEVINSATYKRMNTEDQVDAVREVVVDKMSKTQLERPAAIAEELRREKERKRKESSRENAASELDESDDFYHKRPSRVSQEVARILKQPLNWRMILLVIVLIGVGAGGAMGIITIKERKAAQKHLAQLQKDALLKKQEQAKFEQERAQAVAAAQAEAIARSTRLLSLDADPGNSEVYLDGKLLGRTPLREREIPGRQVEIVVKKKGYREWRKTLAAGTEAIRQSAHLQNLKAKVKTSAAAAEITVGTYLGKTPWWADVFLDGKPIGKTLISQKLVPGRHQIKVVRAGYKTIVKDVDIKPGQKQTLRLQLQQ